LLTFLEFAPRGDTLFSKAKALAARTGVEKTGLAWLHR